MPGGLVGVVEKQPETVDLELVSGAPAEAFESPIKLTIDPEGLLTVCFFGAGIGFEHHFDTVPSAWLDLLLLAVEDRTPFGLHFVPVGVKVPDSWWREFAPSTGWLNTG